MKDVRKNLHTDRGKKFYNLDVQKILKKYNINHYFTYSVMEASVIEFNRTYIEGRHGNNLRIMEITNGSISYRIKL